MVMNPTSSVFLHLKELNTLFVKFCFVSHKSKYTCIHITLKHVYSMFSSQNFSLHLPKKLFESQKKLMMGFETKRQQEVTE